MKCGKCGYDDQGTGDFAHVCIQGVSTRSAGNGGIPPKTIRDEFAIEAMKCFCTPGMVSFFGKEGTEDFDKMVASRAYEIADAMMRERASCK